MPYNAEILVIGCQPESVSALDVKMEVNQCVEEAIPKAIKIILKEIGVCYMLARIKRFLGMEAKPKEDEKVPVEEKK